MNSERENRFDLTEYFEKLNNLSDRNKREICNCINFITYYEEMRGKDEEAN